MSFIDEEVDRYPYWIEERESIRIKKEDADADPPWTEDEILKMFKFCQV